jgi:hypothetical protein
MNYYRTEYILEFGSVRPRECSPGGDIVRYVELDYILYTTSLMG